ncbi:MAG: insulinase family protein [Gammaproteobacteria bacterium]|nr:MAG: insulinase family protein [Gammaproteobacteria bacterium]
MMAPATIQKSLLPNGVRILSYPMATRSAAIGLWWLNGGRHQRPEQCGYAHLLEHLLFKGTAQYDAETLARRFEAMGGRINAHTGRELTALHGLVPAENAPELLDLLIALLLAPKFNEQDAALERNVVLQEMALIAGQPAERLEERGIALTWPDHPIGWPLLGRREVLEQVSARALHDYLATQLSGDRLYVVAAGAMDHAELARRCAPLAALPGGGAPVQPPPRHVTGTHRETSGERQRLLLWIMPAPAASHPDFPALLVANHLLAGGVSSRLFQELRERRGLVYDIRSRHEVYSDTGLWFIQTACDAKEAENCRRAVEEALQQLIRFGPRPAELETAQRHLRADLLIEADDPDSVMERLAREAIYLKHHPSLLERSEQLAAVTPARISELLKRAVERATCLEDGG